MFPLLSLFFHAAYLNLVTSLNLDTQSTIILVRAQLVAPRLERSCMKVFVASWNSSIKRSSLFLQRGSEAWILSDSSLGEFLHLCRGSALNGLSVKSAGLKARGPSPLGRSSQCSTLNYFTLITPSGNFSYHFPVRTKMKRPGCYLIRKFLCDYLQTIFIPQHSNIQSSWCIEWSWRSSDFLICLKRTRGSESDEWSINP